MVPMAGLVATAPIFGLSSDPVPNEGIAPGSLRLVLFRENADETPPAPEPPTPEPQSEPEPDEPNDKPLDEVPDPSPRPEPPEPTPKPDPMPEPVPVPVPVPVVEPGPGELVIVKLNSGQSFAGILLEKSAEAVAVDVNGLRVKLNRADIASIEYKPTRYDEYARLRAAIPEDDVSGTASLVLWLIEQEMFDEALAEAERLVEVRIGDADATRLLRETQATIRLRQRDEKESGDGGGSARDLERQREQLASEIERVRFGPNDFPVLSREQINLMKVYEIDISNPPRLRITHDTIDRLFAEYGEHPLVPESRQARDVFRRKPAHEILDVMFRAQARTLYGDVQVIGNPHAMEKFRDDIHARWLINSCASTRCHGGKGAGRFVLRNIRRNTDETFYTNFLIIDRYRTEQGLPLLNWSDPPRSPLMHYALPRDDALFPHPEVDGWTPTIRSRSDRNFQDAMDWMRSMYLPRPDYGIDYESPTDLAERLAREAEERDEDGPAPETRPPGPER